MTILDIARPDLHARKDLRKVAFEHFAVLRRHIEHNGPPTEAVSRAAVVSPIEGPRDHAEVFLRRNATPRVNLLELRV